MNNYYTPLPKTITSNNHQQASTSQKQIFRGAGVKLQGWPYPAMAFLNPGFRLWAAPPPTLRRGGPNQGG